MSLISLQKLPFRLVLDAVNGGSIRTFELHSTEDAPIPLMRPVPTNSVNPLDMACFPLVPFSNRIGYAQFVFAGQLHTLPCNFPPEPHMIHGHGWHVSWSVSDRLEDQATLSFRHDATAWPWCYTASETFWLRDDGLEMMLSLTNDSTSLMVAGFGLHPFFPKPSGTALTASLGHVWENDEWKLPSRRIPLPEAWDFNAGRVINNIAIDNCFGDWSGEARIDWPSGLSLAIEADRVFGNLVIYNPPHEDFFCVEPASHANDAVNLRARGFTNTGLRVLFPGERMAGRIRLRVVKP